MKKLYIPLLVILLLFATKSKSQDYILIINYTTAAPLGNLNDYIGNYSWRGISIEQRYFMDNNKTLGFLFGWQVYNDKKLDNIIDFGNGNLYGNQYRYVNAYPIHAIGHYHFNTTNESPIQPYVGLGVGIYSMNKLTEMGLYTQNVRSWHFGFAPEVGLRIDIAPQINFNLSTKYNYAVGTSKADAYSWLNINAGLIFVH